MNTSNIWKQNLDEMFRSHESRIERELYEMSRTIESHAPSKDDDSTFMTALFEYIQLRLIATCKKVEVNFLARQTVPEPRSDCARSTVDEANDCCEEFYDNFPNQVLKIVEDTDPNENDASKESDSNDENDDCSGSNETLVGFRSSSIDISD